VKVLIAVPCMDTIDVDFAQSLVQLHTADIGGPANIAFLPGSLIYVARDMLADQALAIDAEYMLWLDSDIVFGPELLHDLMAAKKDFITGLYFKRRPPFNPVLYKKVRYGQEPSEFEAVNYDDYPVDSIFEIDACGFGAVLMKTQMIRDVRERYHHAFAPMQGFGEDISFCIRARQVGHTLHCDSRIKLGHVTRSVSNEETFLALKARAAS